MNEQHAGTDPQWIDEHGNEIDEDHRGLVYDIRTLIDRRVALGIFGTVGLGTLLAACAPAASGAPPTAAATASASATPAPTATPMATPTATVAAAEPIDEVPDETEGPYPGDGSNGVDVLEESGIVRSDIRSSFGSSTTTAEGVPLTFSITVRDAASGAALAGAGVYVWHCDREGRYSLYSDGATNENYLRGVQATDAAGTVTFTSIFPACYAGRWPHIHFEVYQSTSDAVANGPIVKTSQIALPQDACEAVYATSGYDQSVRNLSQISLDTDMVFSDDHAVHQLATIAGDTTSGYTASLTIGV
ncbi:intradiol ring-cleavage dioxygenase [Microbacterium sp. ZW T5_56]|uniref:intradiol ring-cleavage dioxygenase n=1 Tax=Microbacterium sp. ZW T5_56 TaxID=3378081 RepID=UPI0038532DC1